MKRGVKVRILTVVFLAAGLCVVPAFKAGAQATHTIQTISGAGGTITPAGGAFPDGSTPTFQIAANPGFLLRNVLVDGIAVGKRSSYTFPSLTMDHTLRALFERKPIDYFAMDAGDFQNTTTTVGGTTYHMNSVVSLTGSAADPYRVDTTGDSRMTSWYRKVPGGLGLTRVWDYQGTLVLTNPLLYVKNNVAGGDHWVTQSAATLYAGDGGVGTGTIWLEATAQPKIIMTVPAGAFEVYPIVFKMTVSGQSVTTQTWTEWFAPYLGTVRARELSQIAVLSGFGVCGGVISTPPPIITGVSISGNQVTVNGWNFGARNTTNILSVGGKKAIRIALWSNRQIICTMPAGTVNGDVAVFTGFWTSNTYTAF